VGQFLADAGGRAPASAVYVLWIGGNDVSDALVAAQSDPALVADIIGSAVSAVAGSIYGLWSAGARNVVVLNVPDPALAPFVRALGPQAQAAATQIAAIYNGALAGALAQLGALPGVHITQFDVAAVVSHIVATSGDASLGDVATPCLAFGVVAGAVCEHPNQYLFWDGAHPTKAGHRLIAEAVERLFHDGSE
jgi:phospholipase/lecithinase/hemolysin